MRRTVVIVAVAAAALCVPAAAWAHAALLKTVPTASAEVDTPPTELRLTYDEVVEPRFAVVSVTDAAGHQQVDGPVHHSASNPYELDAPLKRSAEGWYLVFWRVISADGHPVRGVFTYRIGPNPGPPPQFVVPSLSETAVTPGLIGLRWLMFLSFMCAIGLFVFRAAIARPASPRISAAFGIASAVALVATPIYVLLATAQFALRSFWDVGTLVPLMGASAFGRGFLRLEVLLALFAAAGGIAIWLDRPERRQRSVAGLLSLWGALLAAGAVLLVPGTAGHAAQTPPRWASLLLDWSHLASGSIWFGGLVALLLLGRRTFGAALARFSNVALASVVLLLGSGVGAAVVHLPTIASLWQTGYGKTIIVKAALLLAAILIGAVNLIRTRRRLDLLWQTVAGEIVLVGAAIVAAAVLSSLPPPPKALASLGTPSATVGPGPVTQLVTREGYRVEVRVTPNKVAQPDSFEVRLTRNGAPVRGASVVATFAMLDMEMPNQEYRLTEVAPGVYRRSSEALVMVGRWGLTFEIQPSGALAFDVVIVDHARG